MKSPGLRPRRFESCHCRFIAVKPQCFPLFVSKSSEELAAMGGSNVRANSLMIVRVGILER